MTEKKYSKDHEWVFIENEIATVGITNYAQESLGDIVFIELPETGKTIKMGDQVGVIESVKVASELYSPVSGKIIEINNELKTTPQLLNTDPENPQKISIPSCSQILPSQRVNCPRDAT